MKFIFNSIGIIIIIWFSVSCSSHIEQEEKLEIEVENSKINAWLNLMPGSPGSFHISGEFNIAYDSTYGIKNSKKEDLDSILVTKVEVYQAKNLLYSFTPAFESKSLHDGNMFIKFNSQKRLSINKELDPEKHIDLVIHFYSAGKIFSYKAEGIKIEKAY